MGFPRLGLLLLLQACGGSQSDRSHHPEPQAQSTEESASELSADAGAGPVEPPEEPAVTCDVLLEGHGCPGCRGGSGRQTTCEEIEEGFRIRAEILEALNIDYARNQGAPLQRHGDEVVETYVWIHDRTGRRLSQEHRDLRSGRRNVERYVHDDRDRVIEIQAADPGNSRRRILYRRLDEQGNLLRLEEDFAGDGSLDRIYEYTYDEEGRGLTQATDRDGDGAFEMRCTFVEPCRPPPPFRCPMRCEDGP